MSTRQSQREAVLNALQGGPKTTWQLGYGLNICCVTKRISELRRAGHQIVTSERRLGKTRIVTYTLVTRIQGELYIEVSNQQNHYI